MIQILSLLMSVSLLSFIEYILPPILYIIVFPGLIVVLLMLFFMIWLERKVAAKTQLRFGPLYVSKKFGGIIQTVADLIRFSFQEFIIPAGADVFAYIQAPGLLMAFGLLPLIFIPVGPYYATIFPANYSLLIVVPLIIITPIYVILLGWASDNKFSFVGSMREAFLVISYEIPLILSVLAMILLYGSVNAINGVSFQIGRGIPGIVLNPIAAFLFLVVMIRTTGRFPFEISEAESEVVMGPYTEYSALFFGIGMSLPYIELYSFSLLFSVLFLGGWWPIVPSAAAASGVVGGLLLPGLMVFIKALIVMAFLVFLRAVYPRYRIDQAITVGWDQALYLGFAAVALSMALVWSGLV